MVLLGLRCTFQLLTWVQVASVPLSYGTVDTPWPHETGRCSVLGGTQSPLHSIRLYNFSKDFILISISRCTGHGDLVFSQYWEALVPLRH